MMDESSGCCGLVMIAAVIVLAVLAWRTIRQEEVIEPPPPAVAEAERPPAPEARPGFDLFSWWPIGPRASLALIAILYTAGLFLIRPNAIRAKRGGSSNQQAALYALTLYFLSPIVVPAVGLWSVLGAIGRALTIGAEPDPGEKPRKPPGANDLD